MERFYWKTKHKTNFNKENDLLDVILRENGVTNISDFLKPKKAHTHDPFLLNNMKEGVEQLHNILSTDTLTPKIFIKIDCDVDGITSGSVIAMFLKDINPNADIAYAISEDKKHGIFETDITEQYDLIIVPDAGSDCVKECKLIKDKWQTPILILDHHQIDNFSIYEYATVINCNDGQYPHTSLSGVGIVYKFMEAYCGTYNLSANLHKKYLQFVSLGMVADVIDLRNLEARYYVLEGLKEEYRNNKFLEELCNYCSDELKLGHSITSYGWVLAPILNSLVRYGKQEEKNNTIRAILGEQETLEYQPRRKCKDDPKPPLEYHSLQKTMARVCTNCKSRQDSEVRRLMEKLIEKIEAQGLSKNNVIIIDGTDILNKNTITGLVANKLASEYKRPVIVLKEFDDNNFGGSARGYGKSSLSDFKGFLNNSKLITVAGHSNAMGITTFSKKNVKSLIDYCNVNVDKNDLVDVYEVDYEIEADSLKEESIMKIAEAYEVWGNGIEEPTFVIQNIHIPTNEIEGIKNNEDSDYVGFIRFKYNNLNFIKKYCKKTDFEEITLSGRNTFGGSKSNKKIANITIIGSFRMNEWDGVRYPQIIIKHFYSEEYKENDKDTTRDKRESRRNKDDFVF